MSTHDPQAKTRTGQKVLQYLKAHPDEMSPARIAKETGCDRETARNYLRRWQASRGNPPASAAESSAAGTPPAPSGQPPKSAAESRAGEAEGRSFDDDFPRRKPAPKPTPPNRPTPPPPPPEPEPEAAAPADRYDDEDDGPLGWLL